jgi:hypothetical protein
VAQAVEHLPNKHKALNSGPSTTKKKKKNSIKGKDRTIPFVLTVSPCVSVQFPYRKSDPSLFLWPMWSASWNLSALKPGALGRCPNRKGVLKEEALPPMALGKTSLTA